MAYNIIIKQGNLLEEENSDFMVNASNTKLLLGSGVSMAFKRHCGHELQKEMDETLKELQAPIEQGYVILTSPGKATNFKYALHVAVMNYTSKQTDKNPTLKTIQESLGNIEVFLFDYSLNTSQTIKLVLPLLGCGVGGLDKVKVTRLYKSFFTKYIDIDCDVVIYGYTEEDYDLIINIINSKESYDT